MEKQCEICGKKYKARRKEQKYCSIECQHESYRKIKVEKVKTTCLFCMEEFYVLPNKLNKGKGKYCCRECKDNHQKIIYSGSNHPTFGRIVSDEEKKMRSKITKKLWQNDDYRLKIKKSCLLFTEKNGYWPGNDIKNKKEEVKIKIKEICQKLD